MDHVIDDGNRLFADTRYKNSWVIYHDALPQWWEADAQAHLAKRGFAAHLKKEKRFSMGTPDEAWRTMVAAWDLVPEERIVEDVERFVTALEAIIAAKGAYVEDMDLRNGHREVMQRLVRGGAPRDSSSGRAATEALIEEGLAGVMKTWEGISAKFGG